VVSETDDRQARVRVYRETTVSVAVANISRISPRRKMLNVLNVLPRSLREAKMVLTKGTKALAHTDICLLEKMTA
jgi:hypothetical protein